MKTLQEVLMDKKRTYIMFFFLISILVLLIVMAANKDTLFKRVDKVTYHNNNCTETYINGKLNSSKCPESTLVYPSNIPVINITSIINKTIETNETIDETIINITDILNLTGINLTDNQTDLIPILAE